MIKKYKIIFILVILIAIVSIIFINSKKTNDKDNDIKENEIITNNNKGVVENKIVSDVLFSNIKYTFDGENTKVEFSITNNKEKAIKLNRFNINTYDKDDNLIKTIKCVSKTVISPGTTVNNYEVEIGLDLSNAYSMKIELLELEITDEEE